MDLKHVKYALFKLLHDLKNGEKDEVLCGLTCKTHISTSVLLEKKKKKKMKTTKSTEGAPVSRVA